MMKGNIMKKVLIFMLPFIISCSTVATQSDDGKILVIKGSGHAKFENGAEIEGGTWFPKLPKIEIEE